MLNRSISLFENFELGIILLIEVLCTVLYKEMCSTYIQLLCKNTSSIFCTWFDMFDIRIKLIDGENRAEYDNSNSASGLQIGPLSRKLQAFICSTCSTYIQLLCMKTSSIFCAWFDMFNIRVKLMY